MRMPSSLEISKIDSNDFEDNLIPSSDTVQAFPSSCYPHAFFDENAEDTYHGVKVKDPYQWMENVKSDQVLQYTKEINELCDSYIQTSGVGEQSEISNQTLSERIYLSSSIEHLPGQLFLSSGDLLSHEKLSNFNWSSTGNVCAYQLRLHESDFGVIKFRTKNGTDLPDTINGIYAHWDDLTWLPHDHGVLYWKWFSDSIPVDSHFPPYNNEKLLYKLYFHKLGADSKDEDVLVQVGHKNDFREIKKKVCVLGDFLFLSDLSCCYELTKKESEDARTSIIDRDGKIGFTDCIRIFGEELTLKYEFKLQGMLLKEQLLVITNHEAPNRKLVLTLIKDAHNPALWKTLVKEDSRRYLRNVETIQVKDFILLTYREEWRQDNIYLYDVHKKKLLARLNPPNESVTSTTVTDTHIHFITTSWLKPHAFYTFPILDECEDSLADGAWNIKSSSAPPNWSDKLSILVFGDEDNLLDWTAEFEVNQVFYPSESEMIPLEIIQPKRCKPNGLNPTIIYAYGGYGKLLPIRMDANHAVFLKHFGGIVAIAHIRGGGYPVVASQAGKDWHEKGIKFNQQNGFNDYAAAAKYLIKMEYTTSEKLIGMGTSKGGMLMTVCARQWPKLFRVIVANAGVYDMLRVDLHKEEFGNISEKSNFQNIFNYSPLHNIQSMKEEWPSMLLLAGSLDGRLKYWHTLKYIGTLHQHLKNSTHLKKNVALAKIFYNSGHSDRYDEQTTVLKFIQKELNLKYVEQ